jgi:UDP-N-acetylmuramoylalanine--D-glutamate ligase
MTLETLALQGHPTIRNSMAASISARIQEVRKNFIRECFSDFQKMEHRMEPVANVHGIEFINDSRSTNLNSTWYTLESISRPVIWIAGGMDMALDYEQLQALLKTKVKSIIFLGMDSTRLVASLAGLEIPITDAASMEEAVELAYVAGKMGDVVLLSPGCASFDLFRDYEERGIAFRNAVKQL